MQTTFSSAKYNEPATGDRVYTPWGSVSNLTLCALYCGFFIIYKDDLSSAKLYWAGVLLYTVGYFTFGLSGALTWTEHDDASVMQHANLLGSIFFTIGSVCLVIPSTPPWGDQKYRPAGTWLDFFLGPPRIWWGSCLFLIGSICFWAGSQIFIDGDPDALGMPMFQIGIITFVPGRIFFLWDALTAIKAGREFRYAGTAAHVKDVSASIRIGKPHTHR